MSEPFAAVFFNQSLSAIFLDLAGHVAQRLGPVLVHTGTPVRTPPPGVTVWPAPAYDNRSLRSRARTWGAYMAAATRDAWRVPVPRGARPPVAFLASNPPMLPALGYALAAARGWPYVLQILDVYPDVLARHGMVRAGHPALAAWGALNRRVYARASCVTTLGEVMADTLAPYMPPGVRATVVPTWVDPRAVTPREKADNWFAREHGLVAPLVALYSGNLGLTHDLRGLFGAAQRLEAEGAGAGARAVQVLVIGNAQRLLDEDPSLRDRASVRFLPYQPAEVVPYSMASGDVGVVTLGAGIAGISMPSKTYFLMAAGNAILGLGYGGDDVERLLARHRCGLYARADDPAAIAAALRRFRDEPAFLAECKRNARRAAETEFSADVCFARFTELFAQARAR